MKQSKHRDIIMNAQKFDRYIIIFISNFQNPTVTKNGCGNE